MQTFMKNFLCWELTLSQEEVETKIGCILSQVQLLDLYLLVEESRASIEKSYRESEMKKSEKIMGKSSFNK